MASHDHACSCGCDGHHGHGHAHEEACARDERHGHGCGCEGNRVHGHAHGHDHGDSCGCGCDVASEARELAGDPTETFAVLGLDCPSCAKACENAVRAVPGVADASLNYATATLSVVLAPSVPPVEANRAILAAVRSCGNDLELTPEQAEVLEAERSWYAEHRETVLMAASGSLLLLGVLAEFALGAHAAASLFYAVAAVAGVVFVAPMAAAALRRRTADMNVLMGIAVIGALVMGLYESLTGDLSLDTFRDAAVVIFLDQVGEWLEGWSMRRTRGSIETLMELAPETAHLLEPDGEMRTVDLESVEEGALVRVLPGERVPLDGVIVAGDSSFDEAPVTGESVPQDKGAGAQVFGGTLNTVAPVTVRVTSDYDCGTLARIVNMVQGAQAAKAPYEAFVDRFAAAYTPAVVAIALVVGLGVPLVWTLVAAVFGAAGPDWLAWVWRALTLLVIACPCALVISTPVSFVSAITRAAKMGVLVKGGAYLDVASKVDALALDKTGTLTEGAPAVTGVTVLDGASAQASLALAAALERNSTHPLAAAVCEAARQAGAPVLEAAGVREVAGNGMSGTVGERSVAVGKPAFAATLAALDGAASVAVDEAENDGATALVLVEDGAAVAVIAVADSVRATTPEALRRLHAEGIATTLMLTGDNAGAAAAVAKAVGVTDVAAELLPDDKVRAVEGLQKAGRTVAMVGDGINDAPALATADLGVTMGAAASDTALEVADVALLAGDLEALPGFFRLARRTMNVVRENIAFAIGVKALVLVLAVLGYAGMGAAIFADTGVAVLVILNGMRLMTKAETRF